MTNTDKIKEQMRNQHKNGLPKDEDIDKLMKKVATSLTDYEKIIKKYNTVMKDTDNILKITKEKLGDEKKKKNTSFDEENIKLWIKEALLNKGIIAEEKSYSHKPHLASLPYDHSRGRTLEQLTERHNAITDRMKDLRKKREELVKQSNANSNFYRSKKKERDELIKQYEKMKKEGVRNLDDVYELEDEIYRVQKFIDDNLKEGKKISKEIKKIDRIAHDYVEDQRKIKWTAFKNGLLDDTMSPEEIARAKKFVKEHGL